MLTIRLHLVPKLKVCRIVNLPSPYAKSKQGQIWTHSVLEGTGKALLLGCVEELPSTSTAYLRKDTVAFPFMFGVSASHSSVTVGGRVGPGRDC
jgi:hypothetical protein